MKRNRRINAGKRGIKTNPANKNFGKRKIITDRNAGHNKLNIFQGEKLFVANIVRSDRRQGRADIINRLGALLRRNNNFVVSALPARTRPRNIIARILCRSA